MEILINRIQEASRAINLDKIEAVEAIVIWRALTCIDSEGGHFEQSKQKLHSLNILLKQLL